MKKVVTFIADDGASEVVGAWEVGLDPEKDYSDQEWIDAACKTFGWSPKQTDHIE